MSTTNPTNIPTEWEELQIKYGNYAPRPKEITNEVLSEAAIEFAESQDVLADKSLKQLDALEDDVEEDILAQYRQRRLDELKREKLSYKFGEVIHVGKDEYVKEVTEASKALSNQCVVIILYAEANPTCQLLIRSLNVIARRHGAIKFCKAIGRDVIPDFPESRVPTVLIYKNGICINQLLGSGVWGGDSITTDIVEWVLWKQGALKSASCEDDPRLALHNNNYSTGRKSNKGRISYKEVNDISGDINEASSNDEEEDEEIERNEDRRGYSSLALETALRLK